MCTCMYIHMYVRTRMYVTNQLHTQTPWNIIRGASVPQWVRRNGERMLTTMQAARDNLVLNVNAHACTCTMYIHIYLYVYIYICMCITICNHIIASCDCCLYFISFIWDSNPSTSCTNQLPEAHFYVSLYSDSTVQVCSTTHKHTFRVFHQICMHMYMYIYKHMHMYCRNGETVKEFVGRHKTAMGI